MWMLVKLHLILFIGGVWGWKSFRITQEKITMDFIDHKYLDASGAIYKINQTTNGLNGTLSLKFDIPNTLKYYAAVYRKINNEYSMNFFHIENSVRAFTAMDSFGVADLCMVYTKPPAVWPFKKGVTYRTEGWSPDSKKFPPNLPEGNWKVQGKLFFTNKTKIFEASWYIVTAYD